MVEHRPAHHKKIRRRVLSPPSLPPRWGEGVAPPTTPHYSQYNSPETSPLSAIDTVVSLPTLNHPPQFPASGAELLEDLHRRLQAQAVNGSLPRRPKSVYRHRHRLRNRRVKHNMPDLLPSSAWNHPSRHTQYQLADRQRHSLPTSDYSTSPSNSESPPLPADSRPLSAESCTSPVPTTSLPLTVPSPPLQRRRSKRPLTSTMLASPPESTSSGSCRTSAAAGHPTSPASPEISTIPPARLDETTYQNIAQGNTKCTFIFLTLLCGTICVIAYGSVSYIYLYV